MSDDANVSAAQQAAYSKTRVPQADGRPMGSGRTVASAQEGSQASERGDRLEARPRLSHDERMPRSRRLVRGSDIRRVMTAGRRARRKHLDIIWAPGLVGHGRLGLIVPRFRQTAVARNRLRRRLKELWRRELQGRLPVIDLVLRARPESYRAPFGVLREELSRWCETVQG